MRLHTALGLAALVASSFAAPAFAASAMMSSNSMMAGSHNMMLKPGETVVVMPNGETMMMTGKMDPMMMKSAMPMDGCMIMMMGADHMMHMMHDMKMADGKMACAAMSKMAH